MCDSIATYIYTIRTCQY